MVKANSDLYDPSNPLARVIASIENDSVMSDLERLM